MRLSSHFGLALVLLGCGDDGLVEPAPEPDPVFPYPLDDELRLQHLQLKSTHNSYHVETEGNTIEALHFSHVPLDQQLSEQGVRHFELDVRRHAEGYFEVFHLPVVDEQTTCRRFADCLALLKAWSDAHRAHHALVVQLEVKDTVPEETAEDYFAALHAEILASWPETRLVTPAFVQGGAATLADAVSEGWPTLGQLRGKALFTLDDGGALRDLYTHGGTDLAGRLIFADSDPGDAWAAIAVMNDPVADAGAIAAAVAANMLVRTRADADGVEPAAGDTTRREAALASGAQFVSTDFPAPVEDVDYVLEIPDGTPSRCNPVTAPADCTSLAVEDPELVGD